MASAPLGDEERLAEIDRLFSLAVDDLQAGRAEQALSALEQVLVLAPSLVDAHVNAGFALIDLARFDAAQEHFRLATRLKPLQANAYYGQALAYEAEADLELALGAMRTYVHLSEADSAHTRRAWSAIWEWQARLAERSGQGG